MGPNNAPLAERQFRLEGPGDLQHICIIRFDRILHYGPADLSGLNQFSLCLRRKSECESAVCKVHRTVDFMDSNDLGQMFLSAVQLVSVIMDHS